MGIRMDAEWIFSAEWLFRRAGWDLVEGLQDDGEIKSRDANRIGERCGRIGGICRGVFF